MLIKTEAEAIQDFLLDASNMSGGRAEQVFFPADVAQIGDFLRAASAGKTPVTISGAGTGTVGGRVPNGGAVMSLTKLNQIKEIVKTDDGGAITVEAAVILNDLQKAVEGQNLFYPPDPTEWSAQIGGTIVTNASGARSFKYGATREFVERLQIVLGDGEILNLRRGEIFADAENKLTLTTDSGKQIVVPLPTYKMPGTRKHSAGYFYRPQMDAIDLFIGSEGTLGVVTEATLKLIPKPESVLSGVVFFHDENDLLNFVEEARKTSFQSRIQNPKSKIQNRFDARVLEFIDRHALDFMREKFAEIPADVAGAILFEQETDAETEDELMTRWLEILERHRAAVDISWFATNDRDLQKIREFRHTAPVAVNEFIVRHKQRKVSTDMAVADHEFRRMLKFYQQTLDESGLKYITFGHIGDNHLHVNILPRDADEARRAKQIYGRFVARACIIGGTISAEHGIGKLKKQYLNAMFGERYLNEMATVKKALDPAGILGRGVMFDEKYLD